MVLWYFRRNGQSEKRKAAMLFACHCRAGNWNWNLIEGFRSFQLGRKTWQLIKQAGLQDTILPILLKKVPDLSSSSNSDPFSSLTSGKRNLYICRLFCNVFVVSCVLTVDSIIIVIMKGPVQMKLLANRSILIIILASSILFVGCSEKPIPAANRPSEEKPAAKLPAEIAVAPAEPVNLVIKPDVRKEVESEVKKLYDEYFAAVSGSATIEEARPMAEKIIAFNNQMMMNEFAWDIMMRKNIDDAKRDYEIAVKAASIANSIDGKCLTKGTNPAILDTYAMALYKTGKIDQAVATQQKAVDLASSATVQSQFTTRLEIYKKKLPE